MWVVCLMLGLLLLLQFRVSVVIGGGGGGGWSELDALLELSKGIQKDPSGLVLGSWRGGGSNSSSSLGSGSDGCPRDWYGVTCSQGHVTSIDIGNLGLIGELSFGSLSHLPLLSNFSVANNELTGNVSEIGSGLVSLSYLDLHGNGFSGDVSRLMLMLGEIVYVDLSRNRFSGALDLVLSDSTFVSSIRYLNVSYNGLEGGLFPHDGMPYFDSLEVLDVSNNRLEGKIPSFNFVLSLRVLRLGNNHFSGALPQALLQESSAVLSELDLSSNQLEGPVGTIASATLTKLNLSSNRLSGPLPPIIGHCAVIDLSYNGLSGNLSRIKGWGNYVESIRLSSNSLTGTYPVQTPQFTRLTSFEISNNMLEGPLTLVLTTYLELKRLDLSLNRLSGSLLPGLFNSTNLVELNLSGNGFSGPIPIEDGLNVSSPDHSQNINLAFLDLSRNALSGPIPRGISRLHNLLSMNLSRNNFDGRLPENLPGDLTGFDVSYNNFSGVVPENLRRFPASSFRPGNLLLILPDSSAPNGVDELYLRGHNPKIGSIVKIAIVVGLIGIVGVIALLCFFLYYRRLLKEKKRENPTAKHKSKGHPTQDFPICAGNDCDIPPTSEVAKLQPDSMTQKVLPSAEGKDEAVTSPLYLLSSNPSLYPSEIQHPTETPGSINICSPDKLRGDLHIFDGSFQFTVAELSRAPAEVLGRSCHGCLYKARLDCGRSVAVKWLREGIAKAKKEFTREVKKLASIRHPNLVSIEGYYWGPRDHEKLLISNYVDAASLDLYLHDTESGRLPELSLGMRLKISIEVAGCLNFLHNETAIPHGNLKSTNILLGMPNYDALLTDYSLHRVMTPAGTTEQVLNSGALGYRPPEFASSSKPCPSLKSDVYAFGVILLEILTGRSPGEMVCGESGVVDLTDWVRLMEGKGRSAECFDRRITTTTQLPEDHLSYTLNGMLQIALGCILPASERPDIKTVFDGLSSLQL
ncbi:hypothetical protein MLD38_025328 [Melastoma candidum]|uniref:Uncharacterized protein n=1 Tax=Melastoma candidum TaxID=119954 RepID=A0ACB9NUZ7_9MYRT|nr:hypothetical protein MLD38_025328 [Melastoma candidum]